MRKSGAFTSRGASGRRNADYLMPGVVIRGVGVHWSKRSPVAVREEIIEKMGILRRQEYPRKGLRGINLSSLALDVDARAQVSARRNGKRKSSENGHQM